MAKHRRSHSHKRKQTRRRQPRMDSDLKQLNKTIHQSTRMMVGGLGVITIGKAATDTLAAMVP